MGRQSWLRRQSLVSIRAVDYQDQRRLPLHPSALSDSTPFLTLPGPYGFVEHPAHTSPGYPLSSRSLPCPCSFGVLFLSASTALCSSACLHCLRILFPHFALFRYPPAAVPKARKEAQLVARWANSCSVCETAGAAQSRVRRLQHRYWTSMPLL